jgi:hypothetical protein
MRTRRLRGSDSIRGCYDDSRKLRFAGRLGSCGLWAGEEAGGGYKYEGEGDGMGCEQNVIYGGCYIICVGGRAFEVEEVKVEVEDWGGRGVGRRWVEDRREKGRRRGIRGKEGYGSMLGRGGIGGELYRSRIGREGERNRRKIGRRG